MKLKMILIFSLIGVTGCAAMFVPKTKDPYKKLEWANELYDHSARPLPAEKLIREAIAEFEKNNDQRGLAIAYKDYGFFFDSRSLEKWENFYRKNGFLDKSASYDKRYDKSIEYFSKSEDLLSNLKIYDVLTNVQLHLGYVNQRKGDLLAACKAFDRSIESNKQNLSNNPNAKVVVPEGFTSYMDFMTTYEKNAGCEGSK